ncbi:MAG: NADPH:quinone reductase [Burkholderiaceae bacterium]
MQAAWYCMNGAARDVLTVGTLPTPAPAAGEVRVRLLTSGVNPSDVKSRLTRPLTDRMIVPHSDGAGIVEAVGDDSLSARLGERVWVWNGQWQRPFGTAATMIVVPAAQAVALPGGTDFAAGACLGIPALTAFQAIQLLGDVRGKTVLVIGAASAVGHYAAQMAVLAGARVIGTAGSSRRAEHAQAAGVDTTINYKTEPVATRVRELTAGRGADAIVDMDFSSTARLIGEGVLAAHGIVACYGSNENGDIGIPFRPALFGSITVRFFLVYDLTPADREKTLVGLNALLEARQLRHTIGARYALEQIVDAHEAVEQGNVLGNIVIDLSRDDA